MRQIGVWGTLASAVLLSACWGGGGGSGSDEEPAQALVANAQGLWEGELDWQGDGKGPVDVAGLIFGGDVILMTGPPENPRIYFGTFESPPEGGAFTAGLTAYAGSDRVEEVIGGATLTAAYQPAETLTGGIEFEPEGSDVAHPGELDLAYSPSYHRPDTTLVGLADSWRTPEGLVTNPVFLKIEQDGQVTGDDANSCTYSGKISVPEEQVNIYRVESLRRTDCADSPNFDFASGYAFPGFGPHGAEGLVILAYNEASMLGIGLVRE